MARETIVYAYHHTTHLGTISLIPESQGRYKVMISDENMGSYHSPQAAADDVANDHLGTTPWNVDLSTLGIPEDLGEWNRKVFAVVKGLRPA
ncbi:MAG: hypothetical protein U1E69_18375 [Tabrizicola sp.]|uniref:hypothetical protein n=1 Tax=Tabrizicola sp. TaxID=2005166 RepID=UPI002ABCA5EA|nr:hypothetical protein [Tabrizicola sp.]MDZ4088761.1 hypothetical protein [Tabrizicola sp.]